MNNSEFYKMTLDFVDTTSKVLKIATDIASAQSADTRSVNEKAAAMAKVLANASLIDGHETKLAEAQLRNPVQALDVLKNVVDHYAGQLKEANAKLASATLGSVDAPAKTASMKKTSNYVGARRGEGQVSESDQALLRLLK
jgi:hypothetical protein